MLGLEAEREELLIGPTALANGIERIRGVELNPGLGCGNFQDAAADRFDDACRRNQAGALSIDDVVVVVAGCLTQLRIAIVDSSANLFRLSEIEGIVVTRGPGLSGVSVGVNRSAKIVTS